MKVTVIGAGYVGMVAGAGFADFGLEVICADIDAARILKLQAGSVPIYEPGLEELVKRHLAGGRLSFTSDVPAAVRAAQVVFITLGTPSSPDGSADLSQIEAAGREIAANLDAFKLIAIKSTVPVGTAKRLAELIRKHAKPTTEFEVASNPEFLRQGSALEDFMRPNRVVIGTDGGRAAGVLREIYRPLYLIDTPFIFTTPETAELIKYASNSFLAVKISFINEMANLSDVMGVDVHLVAKAMGLDGRIGRKFLHPGPGFGGSCFPKDCRALLHMARNAGVEFSLVESALRVNARQYLRVVRKVEEALGALAGKVIAVLGLSYKPNTSDVRESAAINICRALLEQGCSLRLYDPVANAEARQALDHSAVRYCDTVQEAVEGADALVLATEWNEFRNMDLSAIRKRMRGDVLVDARNICEVEKAKKLGFRYFGIGRH